MRGQRTVGQYRTIDLSLFACMLMLSEVIMATAATRWFPNEPYTVSATAVITAIVMMRWGKWAAIHTALGGLVFCLVSGGSWQQFIIYTLGSLLSLGGLAVIRLIGHENIERDALKTMAYGLTVWLLMALGRGLVSLCFGAGLSDALGFVTTDVISMLFTLVVLWIVRRLDGMLEDQRHYLRRINEEQAMEKGGY